VGKSARGLWSLNYGTKASPRGHLPRYLQIAAVRTARRRIRQFLAQFLTTFSPRDPGLPNTVEAGFISIDC